jgi:hypothetical protein
MRNYFELLFDPARKAHWAEEYFLERIIKGVPALSDINLSKEMFSEYK